MSIPPTWTMIIARVLRLQPSSLFDIIIRVAGAGLYILSLLRTLSVTKGDLHNLMSPEYIILTVPMKMATVQPDKRKVVLEETALIRKPNEKFPHR
jgi:hypothetical protein